ncbi:MAG: UPF0236 family protein [Chloroflexota bacterium]|nr:UPF0236 family protein [Chloroflexota bacterium]
MYERLVHLSTWIPSFEHASRELNYFTCADVPKSSLRRLSEAAGAAHVQVQADQVERLERELPEPPQGPAVQQLSVDGAMVPLVGGEWAEVKTLAIGELRGQGLGEQVRAEELSYYSRLADAESFSQEALLETHRRGTEKAGVVVAVNDGAVWEQGFVDVHRPDSVRVLDYYHAAGYLSLAAQAAFGPGTSECVDWVERQRHELRHGDSEQVLRALRELQERVEGEAKAVVRASLEYLHKRREQIRYAEYELLGLPIGSGAVESANKLLVEERLKGSGMHWARHNVNPMLALRSIAFNDRWEEAWPQIVTQLRAQRVQSTRASRAARRAVLEVVTQSPEPVEPAAVAAEVTEPAVAEPVAAVVAEPRSHPQAKVSSKPAPNHPWRRFRFGRNCRPRTAVP